MSVLVAGSIAFDTIKTPEGRVEDVLGGSAVYFSLAAGLFSQVRLVGAVGEDFDVGMLRGLANRSLDLRGLQVIPGGRTFRWSGEYSSDMNQRETLSVELNVLEDFQPRIPREYRDSAFVFLANGPTSTQLSVLDQVERPRFAMADTMDLWIRSRRGELLELLGRIDCLALNDSEALLLGECDGTIEAGLRILNLGPRRVVIKKGEHGSMLFTPERIVPLPAYPSRHVRDPTGAGDSFAGALVGHLSRAGTAEESDWRRALAYGAVVASFTVEEFGTGRLAGIGLADVEARLAEYRSFLDV